MDAPLLPSAIVAPARIPQCGREEAYYDNLETCEAGAFGLGKPWEVRFGRMFHLSPQPTFLKKQAASTSDQ